MSTFKIVLLSIFSVCIVIGVIVFATQKATSGAQHSTVTVWGTISQDTFMAALNGSSLKGSKVITVNYVQKNASTFDADFVQALADGLGPDIILVRDDLVYKERNRLFTIPYANFSQSTFNSLFVQEGSIYETPTGIMGLPLIIDPMVMYWNRDLFTSNFIAQPPKYWDQFSDSTGQVTGQTSGQPGLITTITHRDANATITQSAVALGQWDNINNAKEILSTLLLQAGTPITAHNTQGDVVSVLNDQPSGSVIQPSSAAVNFYTQFSNPTSPTYTWNASLPSSQNMFLSGSLATYFGFASELLGIQQKNPNLNFDVTYMPQIRPAGTNTAKQSVFAHMYSLSIVKQSKNLAASFTTITALVEPGSIAAIDAITNLPPVRRDLLAAKPVNPYQVVFFNSALISNGWIDPDGVATTQIFRTMIQSINNGSARVSDALGQAQTSLSTLF